MRSHSFIRFYFHFILFLLQSCVDAAQQAVVSSKTSRRVIKWCLCLCVRILQETWRSTWSLRLIWKSVWSWESPCLPLRTLRQTKEVGDKHTHAFAHTHTHTLLELDYILLSYWVQPAELLARCSCTETISVMESRAYPDSQHPCQTTTPDTQAD